jgi:site-specific DNA-methyltransferase (adenine-specific)
MGAITLIQGDCLEEIERLDGDSVHAVCTDPPYGLVEFSSGQVAKLRAGRGGVWRLPPKWDGCERRPLPRFTVLTQEQKKGIEVFFGQWAQVLIPKLRPGGHVLIAGNPLLQMYVQNAMVEAGFENRATILRLYHGFRGGDRPKNAEEEFPDVCVMPRGAYEPWMLFRKPISEKTVAENLRKWGTGGLRMLVRGKPLPDAIASFKTPAQEREIANHPSLKPQHFLRILVRALLPLGGGLVLDPFMGSGSTIAAASCLGYDSIGIEIDSEFYSLAERAIPQLASLYPGMTGETIECPEVHGAQPEYQEQLPLLESGELYRV